MTRRGACSSSITIGKQQRGSTLGESSASGLVEYVCMTFRRPQRHQRRRSIAAGCRSRRTSCPVGGMPSSSSSNTSSISVAAPRLLPHRAAADWSLRECTGRGEQCSGGPVGLGSLNKADKADTSEAPLAGAGGPRRLASHAQEHRSWAQKKFSHVSTEMP